MHGQQHTAVGGTGQTHSNSTGRAKVFDELLCSALFGPLHQDGWLLPALLLCRTKALPLPGLVFSISSCLT